MSSNDLTPDFNLTDIDDEPPYTDVSDDANKFEQEIQRDQPNRPSRRHIFALMNEGMKINEPYTPGQ